MRPGKGVEPVTAMGGGPPIGRFGAAVKRVDYRDGTRCPEPGHKRASCAPKG